MSVATNIVNIYNDFNYDVKDFAINANAILNALALRLQATTSWCVAVVFSDETNCQNLNKTYRHKDYVPDVLAFANDDNFLVGKNAEQELGDIYLCYPKAFVQAQTYGHSLTRELAFLFLHGLLHTLGYDHQTTAQETIMFGLQDEILAKLKINRN